MGFPYKNQVLGDDWKPAVTSYTLSNSLGFYVTCWPFPPPSFSFSCSKAIIQHWKILNLTPNSKRVSSVHILAFPRPVPVLYRTAVWRPCAVWLSGARYKDSGGVGRVAVSRLCVTSLFMTTSGTIMEVRRTLCTSTMASDRFNRATGNGRQL